MITFRERVKTILLCATILEYVVLLLAFLLMRKANADTFFPNAEIEQSEFKSTLAFGYELPADGDIIFRQEDVLGYTLEQLTNANFDQLVDKNAVYTRRVNIGTSVRIPPGSSLSLGIYTYNYSGHTVGVGNAWLFLSEYAKPPLSDIVGIAGIRYRNIAFLTSGSLLTKGGDSVELGPLGNFTSTEEGVGVPSSRIFNLGKMSSPIEIAGVIASCVTNSSGGEDVNLSISVRNNGILPEQLTPPVGESTVMLPNEGRVFSNMVIPGGQTAAFLSVLNEVTRCLESGNPDRLVDSPNDHALLLSRNDNGYWQWGGSVLDVPSITAQEHFCVTRIPYKLKIPLPTCRAQPRYKLSLSADPVRLISGSIVDVPFSIENIGGDDSLNATRHMKIITPLLWEQYVTISGNGFELVNRSVTDGASVRELNFDGAPNGGKIQEYIRIRPSSLYPSGLQDPFEISVEVEGVQLKLHIVPDALSTQKVTSVKSFCSGGSGGLKLQVDVGGNEELTALSLPLKLISNTHLNATVKIFWPGGSGTFIINNAETTIVTLPGKYLPGKYDVYASGSAPTVGNLIDRLAVGELSANVDSGCPLTSKVSRLNSSVTSEKNDAVAHSIGQAILGERTTTATVLPTNSVKPTALYQGNVNSDKMKNLPSQALLTISLILAAIVSGLFFIYRPRKNGSR